MSKNYYSINMQKLLFVVKELHSRGYEKLRIVPSLSPSGLSWRCSFVVKSGSQLKSIIASNWLQDVMNVSSKNEYSIEELTDMFAREHQHFLAHCKGKNKEYVEWYSKMLLTLTEGELPYAFADFFPPTDYWKTSKLQKIPTLPNEMSFYFNH